MPPRYGLRLDDHQDLGPAAPEPSQEHPQQPIGPAETRPRGFAVEHAHRLTKGANLKPEVMPSAKDRAHPTEETHKNPDHQASLRDQWTMTGEESRLRLSGSLASGSGFADEQDRREKEVDRCSG